MGRSRKPAVGQLEVWDCPCGQQYTVERTGEVVNTRRYGRREVVRFYQDDTEVKRCTGCTQALHFVFNHQRANGTAYAADR
jgi:hypothetical protein